MIKKFVPLLTLPANGDPYFNTKSAGGYSPCIVGNYPYDARYRTGWPGLNVLPNCVGWAVARFNSIGGYGECRWLGSTNARNLISLAQKQGLTVGQEPKLGGVMVWDDGVYGHAANVEQIDSKTKILVSGSGWYYKKGAMWTAVHRRGDGNWTDGDDKSWMTGYKYLGCIYHPDVYDLPKGAQWASMEVRGKGTVEVPAINLNGNWYVMLRSLDDIMEIADVEYDEKKRMPIIVD